LPKNSVKNPENAPNFAENGQKKRRLAEAFPQTTVSFKRDLSVF